MAVSVFHKDGHTENPAGGKGVGKTGLTGFVHSQRSGCCAILGTIEIELRVAAKAAPMMTELTVARSIAGGALASPQPFYDSWYWALRISGTGAAWRESVSEFCLREPSMWLSPEMQQRWVGAPVLIGHPDEGMLNSNEFSLRAIGTIVMTYVRGTDLMCVARILDGNANELLLTGAVTDTSPAVSFAPGTGKRITVDNRPLLIEGVPALCDHLCITSNGVWTRDGAPGVENQVAEAAA